jgi:hypothetical protein
MSFQVLSTVDLKTGARLVGALFGGFARNNRRSRASVLAAQTSCSKGCLGELSRQYRTVSLVFRTESATRQDKTRQDKTLELMRHLGWGITMEVPQ